MARRADCSCPWCCRMARSSRTRRAARGRHRLKRPESCRSAERGDRPGRGGHMLELYHAEPMANSLKFLLAIHEKGVPFVSRFVNLHKFEQHEPAYVRVNPNGQVPALVHDGKVITESTVINEYLDEVFDGPALRPADPYWRARMRVWTKFVDEYFCPALSFIGWHHMIHNITDQLTPEEFEARVARIPLKEMRDKWRTSAKQGYTKEQLDE